MFHLLGHHRHCWTHGCAPHPAAPSVPACAPHRSAPAGMHKLRLQKASGRSSCQRVRTLEAAVACTPEGSACSVLLERSLPHLWSSAQREQLLLESSIAGESMRRTDLELFWVARAGGDSKGVCHMVPKRGIVCMLLNGHQLYGIIAELCNPGQHILCKQVGITIGTAPTQTKQPALI